MDKQTQTLLIATISAIGIVSLVVIAMLTYSPPTTLSPYDPTLTATPTPTPTPTAAPTPTPTPDPIADVGNMINDTTNEIEAEWDVCDDRHNESWLYSHNCGMYASSGGGGRSSGGCPPCLPIPEPATILSVMLGLAGIAIARRSL